MREQKLSAKPAGFLSYVHDDDHRGRITEFRKELSREIGMQLGVEFPIFQDRDDIPWGQNWKKRLTGALAEVTFLIPIVTPAFFNSPWCRKEFETFLEREKKLGRDDLILPVYYVDAPVLNDARKREADEITKVIASLQYADWRELRFEPFTSPQVGKMLAMLGSKVRDAIEREPKPAPAAGNAADQSISAAATLRISTADKATPAQRAEGPTKRTEPPTLVVDPMHRGNHRTISAAIAAAKAGSRILVRPGVYEGGLVVVKPLEIVGEGDAADIVVQTEGANCLLFRTNIGRVTNLTFRQLGGGQWYGVRIDQGRLELEGCDISSQSLSCVAIRNGADPRIRGNRIHDGKQGGVLIYENGQGTLDDNEIVGNALAGVEIRTGANPTLRRNRIHDGKASGVLVYENGQGTLEDNDIFGNAFSGVEIKTAGNPTLRRNRIRDGKSGGVVVHEKGQGTLDDNEIFGNALAGVAIRTAGNPTLRRNRIHDGKASGVLVYENGQGTLEDNDIFGNSSSGVLIQESGKPTLRRNRINKNGHAAVSIKGNGAAVVEDNDLRDNARGAWDVSANNGDRLQRRGNLE